MSTMLNYCGNSVKAQNGLHAANRISHCRCISCCHEPVDQVSPHSRRANSPLSLPDEEPPIKIQSVVSPRGPIPQPSRLSPVRRPCSRRQLIATPVSY